MFSPRLLHEVDFSSLCGTVENAHQRGHKIEAFEFSEITR
jgi:hypothetical protein